MTIQISITNNEASGGCHLKVEQIGYSKESRDKRIEVTETIPPGYTKVYHVHLLRDLLVSQVVPR